MLVAMLLLAIASLPASRVAASNPISATLCVCVCRCHLQPLEALNPIIQNPAFNAARPLWMEVLNKLKPLLMSIYFGGDHVVWAQQVGGVVGVCACRLVFNKQPTTVVGGEQWGVHLLWVGLEHVVAVAR
jgi:hypothetical protein